MIRAAMVSLVLVAGCSAAPAPEPEPEQDTLPDTCNAAKYQSLVGQDAVAGQSLPDPKRIYGLNDMVTLDYDAARLNVKLDDAGKIAAIDCG